MVAPDVNPARELEMIDTAFLPRPARRRQRVALLLAVAATHTVAPADAQEDPQSGFTRSEAEAAVRQVLVDAYVSGVHVDRDPEAVRRGFHPDFVMLVYDEGELVDVSLQAWLDHMGLDGAPTSDTIRHSFRSVDVTGNAALAIMEIHENDAHIYTDYFSLYRFADGWQIVGKTFYDHGE